MRHSVWIPAQAKDEPELPPAVRASELLAVLSEIIDKYGDLEVFIYDDEYGDDSRLSTTEIRVIEPGGEYWTKYDRHISLGRRDL
jgi:hypothetical protein